MSQPIDQRIERSMDLKIDHLLANREPPLISTVLGINPRCSGNLAEHAFHGSLVCLM